MIKKSEYRKQLLEFNLNILLGENGLNDIERKENLLKKINELEEVDSKLFIEFLEGNESLHLFREESSESDLQKQVLNLEEEILDLMIDYAYDNLTFENDDLEIHCRQNSTNYVVEFYMEINDEKETIPFHEINMNSIFNKITGQEEIDNYLNTFDEI